MTAFTALVLAGSRGGVDPAAAYAGVGHKALIELGGQTLLARVVGALERAGAGRIAVATDNDEVAAALAGLAPTIPHMRLGAAAGPSQTVVDAATTLGTPLLVTTVDHGLLRPEWVARFLEDTPKDVDVAVLVAPQAAVLAEAPDSRRTWLRFEDGRYSGCNLFLLRTERALGAVRLWRRVEALRKRPWRIAMMLGPGTLVRYAFGRLTLDAAVARLGRLADVRAAAVRTPFGLAAVDVDKPDDVDLVRVLAARQQP